MEVTCLSTGRQQWTLHSTTRRNIISSPLSFPRMSTARLEKSDGCDGGECADIGTAGTTKMRKEVHYRLDSIMTRRKCCESWIVNGSTGGLALLISTEAANADSSLQEDGYGYDDEDGVYIDINELKKLTRSNSI